MLLTRRSTCRTAGRRFPPSRKATLQKDRGYCVIIDSVAIVGSEMQEAVWRRIFFCLSSEKTIKIGFKWSNNSVQVCTDNGLGPLGQG